MNARTFLVTATLTLSLIVPAAAGAQIPFDRATSKQPMAHRQILKANSSAIGVSAYNPWAAYVHGGASTKVAKAITAAAKAVPRAPAPAMRSTACPAKPIASTPPQHPDTEASPGRSGLHYPALPGARAAPSLLVLLEATAAD